MDELREHEEGCDKRHEEIKDKFNISTPSVTASIPVVKGRKIPLEAVFQIF